MYKAMKCFFFHFIPVEATKTPTDKPDIDLDYWKNVIGEATINSVLEKMVRDLPYGPLKVSRCKPPLSACRILIKGVNLLGGLHLIKGVSLPPRLIFGTQWDKMKEFVWYLA